jgi:hypothetical protein
LIDHIRVVQPKAKISPNGLIAILDLPLSPLSVGVDEKLLPKDERIVNMYSIAQNHSFVITVNEPPPPPPPLPGQQNINQVKLDWAEVAWRVDDVIIPEIVISVLNNNGLRLSSMKASWGDGKFIWTMEGTQYVLP